MEKVWLWVTREDDQVEQHIGPFMRYVRNADGRTMSKVLEDGSVVPLVDEEYAAEVYEKVRHFHYGTARDVARELSQSAIKEDETGVLGRLAIALAEIALRIDRRQERTRRGQQRAVWMADFEMEKMVVHVAAE